MLLDQVRLAGCCCDSGNCLHVHNFHSGGSRHNPQDRPNSTDSDIADLVAMAHVSGDKNNQRKTESYMSYDHNPKLFRRGRCIVGKA